MVNNEIIAYNYPGEEETPAFDFRKPRFSPVSDL